MIRWVKADFHMFSEYVAVKPIYKYVEPTEWTTENRPDHRWVYPVGTTIHMKAFPVDNSYSLLLKQPAYLGVILNMSKENWNKLESQGAVEEIKDSWKKAEGASDTQNVADRFVVVWFSHADGEYTINDFDTEQEATAYCRKEIEEELHWWKNRMAGWYMYENPAEDGGYDKSWCYGRENRIGYVKLPGYIKDRKAIVEYASFMIHELHDIDTTEYGE